CSPSSNTTGTTRRSLSPTTRSTACPDRCGAATRNARWRSPGGCAPAWSASTVGPRPPTRLSAVSNSPASAGRWAPKVSTPTWKPCPSLSAPDSEDTMTQRLRGRVAAITGGASGIGEATVRRFHTEGASVVIADIQAEAGRRLADELGDRAVFVRTDVSEEAD